MNMKLNDIGNMEEYLQNDCYCPGEIYDVTGFFFRVFSKDDECEKLGEKKSKNDNQYIICVVCKDQIINFWIDNGKIKGAERYDATDNNIRFMKLWLADKSIDGMKINEFEDGKTERNLNEIMKYASAIIVD